MPSLQARRSSAFIDAVNASSRGCTLYASSHRISACSGFREYRNTCFSWCRRAAFCRAASSLKAACDAEAVSGLQDV